MTFEPEIKIIKSGAYEILSNFVDQARAPENSIQWRCLYCKVDKDIITQPSSKNIALNFLKNSFSEADDAKIFWLVSGHLFIFFTGPVRAVIRNFEKFIDAIKGDREKALYHFFWEVNKFWGYFDQVLAIAIDEKAHPEVPDIRMIDVIDHNIEGPYEIDPALHDTRNLRYKPLLLIIEDDGTTRHFMQAIMEKYCDIAVAWNASQARQMYKAMLPNIAFLDIELPDGNGCDLAELFCSRDPSAFIVMVSGSISELAMARCASAGVKGFVAKPASESKLLRFIDQYNNEKRKKAATA